MEAQSRRTSGSRPAPHIEYERDLVESAIAMVANGDARRVSLLLSQGAAILAGVQAIGRQRGVVVRAEGRGEHGRCDLVVEPMA